MFKKLLIALAVMVPTVMFAQKFGEVDNGFTFIFPKGLAAYSGADVVDCTDMVKAALGVK